MKFKIKHFALFDSMQKKIDWSDLRNNNNLQDYYLPYFKIDYLKKVEVEEPDEITKHIITLNKINKLDFLFSIGSGLAALEYQIKKFSKISVVVTDNNDSVLRLKKFNIFDNALKLNALKDILPISSSYCVLMSRIDTEFNDKELSSLFKKLHNKRIQYIYFIPAELISVKILLVELKILIISWLFNRKKTFCGYARNKNMYIHIWHNYYELSNKLSLGNKLFVLKRKV